MALYHNSKQTNSGRLLENRARNGEGTIEFTCIRTGSGIYTDEEKLTLNNATALKEMRQEFLFTGITLKKENDYLSLESVIANEGVQEGYYLSEIGIYAKLKGITEEVLYCIGLADYPDYVPSSEHERYEIMLQSLIKCYDAENVTIQYDEKTFATAEALHQHIINKDNPHHTSKEQIGLKNVEDTSDMDKPVSTAQQAAIDGAYQQATGYTDQAIADLINGAPSTLDTLGEIAQAMKDNTDVVQALDQAIGTKASQAEVDGHTGNNTIHITASERQTWNDKQTKTGDTKDNIVSFSSRDSDNPTNWEEVGLIESGEKHNSLWNKVSLFAQNIRFLSKLMGNASLSGIADGTVTGAIKALNKDLTPVSLPVTIHESEYIDGEPSVIVEYVSGMAFLLVYFSLKKEIPAWSTIKIAQINGAQFNVTYSPAAAIGVPASAILITVQTDGSLYANSQEIVTRTGWYHTSFPARCFINL